MTPGPDELIDLLAEVRDDPLRFAQLCFPWREPGPLETARLEPWQEAVLCEIRDRLATPDGQPILLARTSGHGIGKSALFSILNHWAICPYPDAKGVITANTETQLKTKTWVEMAKWHRMFIAREFFSMTATALFSRDPEHSRTWRLDLVPWSERNTEAFAGLHNENRRIFVGMDEASAIPDVIHEVTEGALTDANAQIIWVMFGNPTRNQGRFREAFPGGRFAKRWNTAAIDSRTVSFTNKSQLEKWVEDYGDDSDFVRVRVKGEFPRVDATSFISLDAARAAAVRTLPDVSGEPVVLGVDVARFGDDLTVIYPRKGLDARSLQPEIYHGLDTIQVAARVATAMNRYAASVAFVDGTGLGGGVVDQLRRLRVPVLEVQFSSKPDGTEDEFIKYANKRAEIWGSLRKWLNHGAIPDEIPTAYISSATSGNISLVAELTGPNYGYNNRDEIQLESKTDMRRRGVPSPNLADALACTFAYPFYAVPRPLMDLNFHNNRTYSDYNPYEKERLYA